MSSTLSLPPFKNIMLWRHADALLLSERIGDDLNRPLSKKGTKQAKRVAAWLKRHAPEDTVVVSSSVLRARQTAQALCDNFMLLNELAPGASLTSVLGAIHNLADANNPNLLIVGHQPWIGELATHLLTPTLQTDGLNIKKAALWWFKQATNTPDTGFDLVSIQSPGLL